MDRKEFIQKTEAILGVSINKNQFFDFNVTYQEEQDKLQVIKAITEKLNLYFDTTMDNNETIHCEPDWLAMEEEENWIYSIEFNPHLYYDRLPLHSNIITLYRLENSVGKGVYNITGGKGLKNEESHVPELDESINFLFDISKVNNFFNHYKREWQFSCASPELLKSWIMPGQEDFLISKGIGIAHIEIPEQFVIHGQYQSIFKEKHVLSKKFALLDLDASNNTVLNRKIKI